MLGWRFVLALRKYRFREPEPGSGQSGHMLSTGGQLKLGLDQHANQNWQIRSARTGKAIYAAQPHAI